MSRVPMPLSPQQVALQVSQYQQKMALLQSAQANQLQESQNADALKRQQLAQLQSISQASQAQQLNEFNQGLGLKNKLLGSQLQAAADTHTFKLAQLHQLAADYATQNPSSNSATSNVLNNLTRSIPSPNAAVSNATAGTNQMINQLQSTPSVPNSNQSNMINNLINQHNNSQNSTGSAQMGVPTMSLMNQQQQQMQNQIKQQQPSQQQLQSHAQSNQQPNLGGFTPQSIQAQTILGLHPSQNPYKAMAEKEQLAQQAANLKVQSTQSTQQSASNIKKISDAENALTGGMQSIDILNKMKPLIKNNPSLFHPLASIAQNFYPHEERGTMIAYSAPLVAALAKTFSSRGTNLAMKTAKGIKPSIDDYPSTARGKVYGGISSVQTEMQTQMRNIKAAGGDANKLMPELQEYMNPRQAIDVDNLKDNQIVHVQYEPNGPITTMTAAQYKSEGGK